LEYEITNIERFGFWMIIDEGEYFISFNDFPEFQKASVKQILNVQRPDPQQFHWSDLDIDIDLESLKNPDKFPKIYSKK